MKFTRLLSFTTTLIVLSFNMGCRVSSHENGKDKNVEIGTPFGSMHVKTDKAANLAGLGITPYPGATPYDDGGNNHHDGAADVNMSFGAFYLGVKAASLLSHDSEDKILAFYRKDLARYGEVIQCEGSTAVGHPDRTAQGLTCDEHKGSGHGHADAGSGPELRAGSPQHQHIVGVEAKGDGTKIGLVALDLPGHFGSHKDAEEE